MTSRSSIDRLLRLAGQAIVATPPDILSFGARGPCADELLCLLRRRNGFFAFSEALHVLPAATDTRALNIVDWNSVGGWRSAYGNAADDLLFFAEDVFGVQFAIHDQGVVSFDPETAEVQVVSDSIGGWAQWVIDDPDQAVGREFAAAWQKSNGPLRDGFRLMPATPFFLGGEFAIANLFAVEAHEAITHRAELWRQTKDLPEGAAVTINVVD